MVINKDNLIVKDEWLNSTTAEYINNIKTKVSLNIKNKISINTNKYLDNLFNKNKNTIKVYTLGVRVKNLLSDINDYITVNDSSFIIFYLKPNNIPLFIKNEIYIKNGKEFKLRNISDVKDFLKDNKNIKIPLLNNDDTISISNDKILNLQEYVIDRPDSTIIMDVLSEYITSYIMTIVHIESDVVINDVFNISNEYILCNTTAIHNDTFSEFVTNRLVITDINLLDMLEELFITVYENILTLIDIESPSSLEITFHNGSVKINETISPSSKRYFINKYIKE